MRKPFCAIMRYVRKYVPTEQGRIQKFTKVDDRTEYSNIDDGFIAQGKEGDCGTKRTANSSNSVRLCNRRARKTTTINNKSMASVNRIHNY